MGQYYRCVFLTKKNKPKAVVVSYDFGCGAKLTEHSWNGNDMVRFVERQLMIEPQKLVWAGDYADEENPSTLTNEEIKAIAIEDDKYWNSAVIREKGLNLFSLSDIVAKLMPNEEVKNKYEHKYSSTTLAPLTAKYVVNHDKKQFVDKTKVTKDADGWQIHPLPFLTCEGNGRGGGDFRGEDANKLVGSWARDTISVETRKADFPKDYTELIFDLVE
jgi:hypothetical protein